MMKKLFPLFTAIFCILITVPLFGQENGKDSFKVDITQYLPVGEVKVEVLELQTAPDYKELQAKIQKAIEENPEWFSEYSKTFVPGEEVPYHANFGLTEKEYYRLVRGEGREVYMPGDSGKITITAVEDGIYKISSLTKNMDPLDKIRLYLIGNYVESPDFELKDYKTIKADKNEMALTGSWNGHQWRFGEGAKKASFSLGTLEEEGRTILMYKVEEKIDGLDTPLSDIKIVLWPPEKEAGDAEEIKDADNEKK